MSHITKEDIERVKSGKVFVQVNDITHYDAEDVKINGYSLPELLHAAEEAAVYQYRERDVVLTAEMFGVALDKGGILTREAQLRDDVCDRLLPRGMKWPKFEDGEPVLVGDEFETMASGIKKVDAIKFEDGYIFSLEFNNGCGTAKFYKNARVKRPEHRETLQDVIDDLYKQVPNQEFGHIIRVPIDLIDRLEAIQERMG